MQVRRAWERRVRSSPAHSDLDSDYHSRMIGLPARLLALLVSQIAGSPALTPREAAIKRYVASHYEDAIRLLEQTVNIPSGTSKARLSVARGKLREALADFAGEWIA